MCIGPDVVARRLKWMCLIAIAVTGPATAQNLLVNPDFNSDVTSWQTIDPAIVLGHTNADGNQAPGAAEAQGLREDPPFGSVVAIQQCVDLTGLPMDTPLSLSVAANPVDHEGFFTIASVLYFSDVCDGTFVDNAFVSAGAFPGLWTTVSGEVPAAPATAVAAWVVVGVQTDSTSPNVLTRFDDAYFGRPSLIFADGFESGDTSAW